MTSTHLAGACWHTLRGLFCSRLRQGICLPQQSREGFGEERHGGHTRLSPWYCSSSTLKSSSFFREARRGRNSSRCKLPVHVWFSPVRFLARYCYDDGQQQAAALFSISPSPQKEVHTGTMQAVVCASRYTGKERDADSGLNTARKVFNASANTKGPALRNGEAGPHCLDCLLAFLLYS